jgi:hypothetical protein
MDERIRQTDVRVEGLHDQIRQVAEGVAAGNERLESFRKDVGQEFNDVRALIHRSYKQLDQRVRKLEAASQS